MQAQRLAAVTRKCPKCGGRMYKVAAPDKHMHYEKPLGNGAVEVGWHWVKQTFYRCRGCGHKQD